jgi:exodeoxyribonuclease V alpha subunit
MTSSWPSPLTLAPEIDLLVRRWALPSACTAAVQALLNKQREGSTAAALPSDCPLDAESWGAAAQVIKENLGETAPTPLILRQYQALAYVQAWRFFSAEQTIARELMARAARPAPRLKRPTSALLADLGPTQVDERQAAAITCALENTLALIVGGPGTGKTHTLARLLALLIAEYSEKTLVIHLAAPTGKAADRMKEAVEVAADRLPTALTLTTKNSLKAAAAGASTLHRLLGFDPSTGRCRFHAGNKLRCDVVIVDECSMIDTLLWQALLTALEPDTRLVLVGDPHQLESVSAGDILGALVRFARTRPNPEAEAAAPLARVLTELTQSQRFRHRPAIGLLATAVVTCAAQAATHLLSSHLVTPEESMPAGGLGWLGDTKKKFNYQQLPASVRSALSAVADAATPLEALNALAKIKLLTAHREGSLGAAGLNTSIQRSLHRSTGVNRAPNQPIIINQNDPQTGLTNGSIGVIMEIAGVSAAYFPAAGGDLPPRLIPISQLPNYTPAWAMTIHRSQGSEFDQVVVILPTDKSPLATRELIYTAITRARQCVYVWGSTATIQSALSDKTVRCTLLEASLQAQLSAPTTAS